MTQQPLPTREIPPTPTPVALAPGSLLPLTDLQPCDFGGVGPPKIDKSWGGNPISIADKEYRRGIGMRSGGSVTYPVPPNAVEFETRVGLSSAVRWCALGSVQFEIRDARDNLLYRSEVARARTPAQVARVRVAGTPSITLIVTDAGDGFNCDHADWADPVFIIG